MRVWLALLLGLLLGACDDREDAVSPDEQVRQGSKLFATQRRGVPYVVLIVLEDSPTPEAQALRELVATSFQERFVASRLGKPESCLGLPDPGTAPPVHRRAILLAPSAEGDTVVRSFVNDPILAFDAASEFEPGAEVWSDAVAEAIRRTETPTPGDYRPLALGERWTRLLARQLEPETDAEVSVLAALPAGIDVETFVASTRDDESPLPAGDYTLLPRPNCLPGGGCFFEPQHLLPDPMLSCCALDPQRLPRFAEQTDEPWSSGRDCYPTCEQTRFFEYPVATDCRRNCGPAAPVTDPVTGAVACQVRPLLPVEAHCQDLGWLDPRGASGRRAPLVVELYEYDYRACDMPQLTGAALASCIDDPQCADCTPGFCATRVPELLQECPDASEPVPWPLRYAGLPNGQDGYPLQVTCNFEP